jgi:hypothetical protein
LESGGNRRTFGLRHDRVARLRDDELDGADLVAGGEYRQPFQGAEVGRPESFFQAFHSHRATPGTDRSRALRPAPDGARQGPKEVRPDRFQDL